ncbi:MAG: hypothetical protein NDI77_01585 [Geobacteraceae bacterium]|nr:hypothetical protein [Geobacteraceae bacterium]
MTERYGNGSELEGELAVNKDDFELGSLEDELRVDGLCKKILMRFYFQLLEEGESPEKATLLAGSADYFVRDFVVAIKERNLFDERPGLVRQFAGNWYIVNTLEPNMAELSRHLEGIRAFYRFLQGRALVSAEHLGRIEQECADTGYYAGRIDSFWAIRGDGYLAWERECTLKER